MLDFETKYRVRYLDIADEYTMHMVIVGSTIYRSPHLVFGDSEIAHQVYFDADGCALAFSVVFLDRVEESKEIVDAALGGEI